MTIGIGPILFQRRFQSASNKAGCNEKPPLWGKHFDWFPAFHFIEQSMGNQVMPCFLPEDHCSENVISIQKDSSVRIPGENCLPGDIKT